MADKAALNTPIDLHQSPVILLHVILDFPARPHWASEELKMLHTSLKHSPERPILSAGAIPRRGERT